MSGDLEHIANVIKRAQKRFKLTPPKPFIPLELDEQIAVFEYRDIAAKQDPRWKRLFATLNGVRLTIGQAKKCKRAGMTGGVLDIWFPCAKWAEVSQSGDKAIICPGVVGDLKRIKGGRLEEDQKWWLEQLAMDGWETHVWKGSRAVIDSITAYLKGE